MNLTLQAAQAAHAFNKCALAHQLVGDAELPKEALHTLFHGVMRGLEERANTTFTSPIRETVWNTVSTGYLNRLKRTLVCEVSKRVLNNFQPHEIARIKPNDPRIHAAFPQQERPIVHAVLQKTHAMVPDFIADTIQAIRNQGIPIRPPYGPGNAS